MLKPLAQKSCACRRACSVKNPKQRAALLLASHSFAYFKIAAGVYIHLKILTVAVNIYIFDVGNITLLRFSNIGEQRSERTDKRTVAKRILAKHRSKLFKNSRLCLLVRKLNALSLPEHCGKSVANKRLRLAKLCCRHVGYHLSRLIRSKLVAKTAYHLVTAE